MIRTLLISLLCFFADMFAAMAHESEMPRDDGFAQLDTFVAKDHEQFGMIHFEMDAQTVILIVVLVIIVLCLIFIICFCCTACCFAKKL